MSMMVVGLWDILPGSLQGRGMCEVHGPCAGEATWAVPTGFSLSLPTQHKSHFQLLSH